MEYCRACGNEWIVGDYDWRSLSDCLRYRSDLIAGMVAGEEKLFPSPPANAHDLG